MSDQAIIPLLAKFRAGSIAAPELIEGLETQIGVCERKLAALRQLQVVPADREEWERYLRPALELSYQGLIATAKLGQEYAKAPSQELAEGIVYTLGQIDKATGFVEQRLSGVSQATQATLSDELSGLQQDVQQLKSLQQGQAQSSISLLDD